MDKIKIGIPRSIFYYYYGDLWISFFQNLNCEIILSPKTNREIMENGIQKANDEMCLSLKNFFGHISYLEGKCDYIILPRIDNYGIENQTCTNFLALYDIISNLFHTPVINYNIDIIHKETEIKGFLNIGEKLGFSKNKTLLAYLDAKHKTEEKKQKQIQDNLKKLKSKKFKVLLIGHPYNICDEYIGKPIIKLLQKLNVEIIYSHLFPEETNRLSHELSKELYWKFSKEGIGTIPYVQKKIDGVIFLSAFPCGPDSLVNELVMRKIKLPYLNLIIDDLDGMTGFETRLESFVDMIQERNQKHV